MVVVRSVDWTMPEPAPRSLIFTSRQAPAALTAMPAGFRNLPVYCIGPGTADAARRANFRAIAWVGEGRRDRLIAAVCQTAEPPVMWARGEISADDVIGELAAQGMTAHERVVYAAEETAGFSKGSQELLIRGWVDYALLTSPRIARLFVRHLLAIHAQTQHMTMLCLSTAVAREVRQIPHKAVVIGPEPTLDSLLLASGLLCNNKSRQQGQVG